jgi:hypothetical protein
MPDQQSALPRASDLQELGSLLVEVIEHPRWIAARDTILSLITGGRCLVLLLGPPGSGTPPGRQISIRSALRGRTSSPISINRKTPPHASSSSQISVRQVVPPLPPSQTLDSPGWPLITS